MNSPDTPTKYVIVIAAGAADEPLQELDGLTPLQAADTPHLNDIAKRGRAGTIQTIPDGSEATSDIALLTIMGYDVSKVHQGRAGYVALPLQVGLNDGDWAMSVSFLTVDDDTDSVLHPTAGMVEPVEARLLLEALSIELQRQLGTEADGLEFITGHAEEHILIDRSGMRTYSDLAIPCPVDLMNRTLSRSAESLSPLMDRIVSISRDVFRSHEVNLTRRDLGDPEATQVWLWGPGQRAALPTFKSMFPGMRGAMLTTCDLAGGIAACAGWDRPDIFDTDTTIFADLPRGTDFIPVPMMDDVTNKAIECIKADQHAIVCVYIESADEATFEGDFAGKIATLEALDHDVVGPLWDTLRKNTGGEDGSWRMIVLADLCALTDEQRYTNQAVPFAFCGRGVQSARSFEAFDEATARASDLHITTGYDFVEYVLFSGVPLRK